MVFEALAAVGLAGNIVQFVDFSCKLFGTAASVYHSHVGSSKDNQNLEDITGHLHELCMNLAGTGVNSQRPSSALDTLAEGCKATAEELLLALEKVKAKKPQSRSDSIKAALRTVWKEKQINSMETRLNSYRTELILQLQVLHWYVNQ